MLRVAKGAAGVALGGLCVPLWPLLTVISALAHPLLPSRQLVPHAVQRCSGRMLRLVVAAVASSKALAFAAPAQFRTILLWRRFMPIYIAYMWTDTCNKFRSPQAQQRAWESRHEWGGVQVYAMVLELSGYCVKLSQVLATKTEFMPPAWTRRLQQLFDSMPPHPWPGVRASIESHLAACPLALTGSTDTPVQSAEAPIAEGTAGCSCGRCSSSTVAACSADAVIDANGNGLHCSSSNSSSGMPSRTCSQDMFNTTTASGLQNGAADAHTYGGEVAAAAAMVLLLSHAAGAGQPSEGASTTAALANGASADQQRLPAQHGGPLLPSRGSGRTQRVRKAAPAAASVGGSRQLAAAGNAMAAAAASAATAVGTSVLACDHATACCTANGQEARGLRQTAAMAGPAEPSSVGTGAATAACSGAAVNAEASSTTTTTTTTTHNAAGFKGPNSTGNERACSCNHHSTTTRSGGGSCNGSRSNGPADGARPSIDAGCSISSSACPRSATTLPSSPHNLASPSGNSSSPLTSLPSPASNLTSPPSNSNSSSSGGCLARRHAPSLAAAAADQRQDLDDNAGMMEEQEQVYAAGKQEWLNAARAAGSRVAGGRLPQRMQRYFEWVESEALASASIAQVHRGRLSQHVLELVDPFWADHPEVVLKVQHRKMQRLMAVDLANAGRLASFIRGVLPFDPLPVAMELQAAVPREFDFSREGRLTAAIRERLEEAGLSPGEVVVPRVLHALSSPCLLVLEQMQGVPFTAILSQVAAGDMRLLPAAQEAVRKLVYAYGHMILREGVFHADPHPGNLLLQESEARCVLLDFGQCKALMVAQQLQLCRLVVALEAGEPLPIALAMMGLGLSFGTPKGGASTTAASTGSFSTAITSSCASSASTQAQVRPSIQASGSTLPAGAATAQPGESAGQHGLLDLEAVAAVAYVMFDTRAMEEARLSPFKDNPVLKQAPITALPPFIWMFLRSVMLLRGLCHALHMDIRSAEVWAPLASSTLADPASAHRAYRRHEQFV